jgi:CxxC-x17-CxxC domain-containing protein
MSDRTITCADCGTDFLFGEREQSFYAERNMSEPKRCKPCRDQRKAQRGEGGGHGGGGGRSFGGGGGGGGRGGERQRYSIVCQQCGKEDTVPFKPSGGRPVLCSACFSAGRASSGSRW